MPPEGPEFLSASQILCYLECPRRYRLHYLDRLAPESRKIELSFGSAVHATIGWWVEEQLAGRTPDETALARTFRADWSAELAVPVPLLRRPGASDPAPLGLELVRLACTQLATEAVTGSEMRFEVELTDRRARRTLPLPLVGYLDFVTTEVVGEIKTASRKVSWRHWEIQLAAYAYAAVREGLPRRTRLIQLVKTKAPAIEVEDLVVDDRDVRWFLEVGG